MLNVEMLQSNLLYLGSLLKTVVEKCEEVMILILKKVYETTLGSQIYSWSKDWTKILFS